MKTDRRKKGKTLGIDIGTTSICLVCREEGKKELLWVSHRENAFIPGTFEQNPEEIVGKVYELLAEAETCGFGAEEIAAIGISSQMHGILYVDAEGQAVSPLYTWKDERGREDINHIGRISHPLTSGTHKQTSDSKSYEAYLSEATGLQMFSGYGTVTHFYLGENGLIPERAVRLAGIGDYLAMRLTGRKEPLLEESMAASFGGFDLEKRDFAWDKLEKAGVRLSFYPKLHKNGEGAGTYKGIPVSCAYGDNQASFLGAVECPEEQVSVNVGTGSQVSVFDSRLIPVNGVDIRPFFGKGYLYVGASLNGGKVYERLAAFFEETVRAFTGEVVDAYEIMPRLVNGSGRAPELQVAPSLYGARGEQGAVGGSITGLTADNFHPGALVEAYVRGMAEELYGMYRKFPEEIREERKSIAASGNGIRRNKLLAQAVEERFALPVIFCEPQEEAAAGAACAAYRELAQAAEQI